MLKFLLLLNLTSSSPIPFTEVKNNFPAPTKSFEIDLYLVALNVLVIACLSANTGSDWSKEIIDPL